MHSPLPIAESDGATAPGLVVAALRHSLSVVVPHETSTGATALVVDDFLPAHQVEPVMTWVTGQGHQFTTSKVMSGYEGQDAEDADFRRSKVMSQPGPVRALFERRLLSELDQARRALGLPPLPVTHVELQVTASNDGDFFKCHNDNAHAVVADRSLTFVYFVHREPKPFRGGHLTLYETTWQRGQPVRGPELLDVEPVRNRMVFFPSHLMHEVRLVECPSMAFEDSRFTINGWYHTSPRSAVHGQLLRRNRLRAGRRPAPGNH